MERVYEWEAKGVQVLKLEQSLMLEQAFALDAIERLMKITASITTYL